MTASAQANGQPARLDSLTGLRFFAAMLVVLGHSLVQYSKIPVVGAVGEVSSVGVVFFFILSGFVLTWSGRPGDSVKDFYRHRFARIYPLYLLTTLIALGLADHLQLAHSLTIVVAVLLLVQAWVPSTTYNFGLNAPAWSLSCEAFFYGLFPVLSASLRRLDTSSLVKLLGGCWLVMLIVGQAIYANSSAETRIILTYVNPLYRSGEFIAGICLALVMRNGLRVGFRPGRMAGLTAVALIGMVVLSRIADHMGRPTLVSWVVISAITGPLCTLLICSAASADLTRRPSMFRRAVLVRLGEWSFALYLTHELLIQSVARISWLTPHTLPQRVVAEVAVCIAAVATSGAFFTLVEHPLERRLRGRPRPAVTTSDMTLRPAGGP